MTIGAIPEKSLVLRQANELLIRRERLCCR
jgi:hypothetical protein